MKLSVSIFFSLSAFLLFFFFFSVSFLFESQNAVTLLPQPPNPVNSNLVASFILLSGVCFFDLMSAMLWCGIFVVVANRFCFPLSLPPSARGNVRAISTLLGATAIWFCPFPYLLPTSTAGLWVIPSPP